jgi:potassium-transporting ATPase KdpC subunit
MRELRAAAVALVAVTLALGLAYPLAMTGAGQALFGGEADAGLIAKDFSRDLDDFQSRPSATGYSASATSFNNLGPNQQELADQLAANLKTYLDRERPATPGLRASQVPPDAVTTSASGVDPHISAANARIQANRVAQRRGLDRARVLELIDEHTSHPLFGLGGEGSVNVRELNLALDREPAR